LVEEFFFRALLQARLAAYFRSEVTGVVLMSLIFGFAHVPGFVLL
jgi:membrane protease YdiL (CAAX protease family)